MAKLRVEEIQWLASAASQVLLSYPITPLSGEAIWLPAGPRQLPCMLEQVLGSLHSLPAMEPSSLGLTKELVRARVQGLERRGWEQDRQSRRVPFPLELPHCLRPFSERPKVKMITLKGSYWIALGSLHSHSLGRT